MISLKNKVLKNLNILLILFLVFQSCNNEVKNKSPRIKSNIKIDSPLSFEIFNEDDTVEVRISKTINNNKKIKKSLLINGNDTLSFTDKIDLYINQNYIYGNNTLRIIVYYGDGSIEKYSKQITVYPKQKPSELEYEIIKILPHDPQIYTQGLILYENHFYESSGQYGKSFLRKYTSDELIISKEIKIDPDLFAEGIAILNDKLFMLTWKSNKGLVFDKNTLALLDSFKYNTEGWGLTNNERELIMSDGSEKIKFIDPSNFKINKEIQVFDNFGKVESLNELEYINGKIFSNIYGKDKIAVINPLNGLVENYINLEKIINKKNYKNIDVMNGIAFNKKSNTLYITGKWWPSLFEIKLNTR